MAGEIHGIISREEAWKMWAPYGERLPLDGSLDPTKMTPFEAELILMGADNDTQEKAWKVWYETSEDDSTWHSGVRRVMAVDPPEQLVDLLCTSHLRQQKIVDQKRNIAIEQGGGLTRLLGIAAQKLVQEDIFTPTQAELIESWLTGPDGNPYIQYTPMTRLEFGRLARHYLGVEPPHSLMYLFHLATGSIWSNVTFNDTRNSQVEVHNRVHESVHGNFSGVEIYDTTKADGRRFPEPAYIGLFGKPPTTEHGYGYGEYENAESNEGWTDWVAVESMRLVPQLGRPLEGGLGGYTAWADKYTWIRKYLPELFRRITDAVLTEATPMNPTAKRDAIRDVRSLADRELGETNALTKLMLSSGGSLQETHDNWESNS